MIITLAKNVCGIFGNTWNMVEFHIPWTTSLIVLQWPRQGRKCCSVASVTFSENDEKPTCVGKIVSNALAMVSIAICSFVGDSLGWSYGVV